MCDGRAGGCLVLFIPPSRSAAGLFFRRTLVPKLGSTDVPLGEKARSTARHPLADAAFVPAKRSTIKPKGNPSRVVEIQALPALTSHEIRHACSGDPRRRRRRLGARSCAWSRSGPSSARPSGLAGGWHTGGLPATEPAVLLAGLQYSRDSRTTAAVARVVRSGTLECPKAAPPRGGAPPPAMTGDGSHEESP